MITDDRAAKLGNIVLEVDQVFRLLMRGDVVEVNVFVTPFEVVDDALVRQLLLHDENILEEVDDALLNIKMVKLCNHGLLVFQVALIRVNKSIPLVDHVSNVVKNGAVRAHIQLRHFVSQILVLLLLFLQLIVHVFDLNVVAFELPDD